jgi:hypothetical protein
VGTEKCPVCREPFSLPEKQNIRSYECEFDTDEEKYYQHPMERRLVMPYGRQPISRQVWHRANDLIKHMMALNGDLPDKIEDLERMTDVVRGFWVKFFELNPLQGQTQYLLPTHWTVDGAMLKFDEPIQVETMRNEMLYANFPYENLISESVDQIRMDYKYDIKQRD